MRHFLPVALLLIGSAGAFCGQPRGDSAKPMFPPSLGPVADANPAIREPVAQKVPTLLKLKRTTDTLSMGVDYKNAMETAKIDVGSKMITGLRFAWYVYPEGEASPDSRGGGLVGPDFNIGTVILNTKQSGIPAKGVKYVVELELVIFETDIPPQHMWSPESSKNFKILWKRTLKQVVPP